MPLQKLSNRNTILPIDRSASSQLPSRAPSVYEPETRSGPQSSQQLPDEQQGPSRRRMPRPEHSPQKSINDFWDKFNTKHPGKIFTILPDNLYAKRAAHQRRKDLSPGQNAIASYAEAVAHCKAKVDKIVKECRRINQKYRDPHFDIEADFRRSRETGAPPDCLTALNETTTDLKPMSVKRVEVSAFSTSGTSTCSSHGRTFSKTRNSLSKAPPPTTSAKATMAIAGSCLRCAHAATRKVLSTGYALPATRWWASTALSSTEVSETLSADLLFQPLYWYHYAMFCIWELHHPTPGATLHPSANHIPTSLGSPDTKKMEPHLTRFPRWRVDLRGH